MADPIRVTAGVIRQADRVLVCRRLFDVAHGGQWEFPGGKVEPGEELAEALRRELREELSIDAVVGTLLFQHQHVYPGRPPVDLSFFAVPSYRGTLRNQVFAEIRWLPVGTLGTLDFLEGDREIVRRLDDGTLVP